MRWGCLLLLLASVAVVTAGARADEIHLKDGSKVVGTIVGYDDGTFKIETAYGFALVRKDSIAEIVPGEDAPGKGKSGEAAPAPSATKDAGKAAAAPPTKPAGKPAAKATASAQAPPAAPSATTAAASDGAANSPFSERASEKNPAKAAAPPTESAAAPAAPPKPAPVPLREEVGYNLYSNQTYGFSMYKPPSWDLLREARSALPEAITALGTSDGSTMLVIGRDTQGGALDARAAATATQLQEVYDHYRPLSSRQLTIAGLPAAEQRFRGNADGHDWSVTVVTLERGSEVFTILGMTYADSDLIQLQENVIAKSIGSLQFTARP